MSQDPQGSADFAENFHFIQPHRDPESNWAIDIAKNLEDYLLKIYSGEITGKDDGIPAVNFAEAALMVQGSVQVYSRKVEYLHSLVLHALETIKQQRQPEQLQNSSGQPEDGGKQNNFDEFDPSCSYDDIEVDPNNTLDESATTSSDAPLYNCARPPPELAFLEGGFSDANSDSGELGSYLLAKTTFYRDFLLLDPSDAAAVDAYYQELDNNSNNEQNGVSRDSSFPSKACKGFQSPTRQSGGSACRLSVGMNHDAELNQSPPVDNGFEIRNHEKEFRSPPCKSPGNNINEFAVNDEFPGFNDLDDADDDEEDDPWKPLNPHEPGNLKVQPFRRLKVKAHGRDAVKSKKVTTDLTKEFPLAPLNGFIEPSLNYIWEAQQRDIEKQNASQSPTLYEKLRESLVLGGVGNFDAYSDSDDDNEDNGYDSGDEEIKAPDFDMPETMNVSISPKMRDDGSTYFNIDGSCGHGNSTYEENLEDLCRSHLDSLLASIGEFKKHTGIAARVSSWKHKIEKKLEEQEARPAFDIHEYGEKVMSKVSLATDSENGLSFNDLVSGQDKADVARSFSALLQLVNNGNVDLQKFEPDGDNEPVCHSATHPFYVRPLRRPKRRQGDPQQESEKKAKALIDAGEMKDGKSKPRKERREPASSSGSGSISNSM